MGDLGLEMQAGDDVGRPSAAGSAVRRDEQRFLIRVTSSALLSVSEPLRPTGPECCQETQA